MSRKVFHNAVDLIGGGRNALIEDCLPMLKVEGI